MSPEIAGRLALAVGLSALVHLWLLQGLAVGRLPAPDNKAGVLRTRIVMPVSPAQTGTESRATEPEHPAPRSGAVVGPTRAIQVTAVDPGPMPADAAPVAVRSPPMDESAAYDARPHLDAPLIVDATVYAPQELDIFPEPLTPIRLPQSSRVQRAGAGVTLELVIDEEGFVTQARDVDADTDEDAVQALLESLRTVRFSPGQRDGRAVRARVAIKVELTGKLEPQGVDR